MEKNSKLKYDQSLSEEQTPVKQRDSELLGREVSRSADDTKRKIRAAFAASNKVKATLRVSAN